MFYRFRSLASRSGAIAAVLFSALCWSNLVTAQSGGRVAFTPETAVVTAGTSASIRVMLDEPIICPPSTPPVQCLLQLELVPPSSGVTFSTETLEWLAADWSQERSFVITVAEGTPLTEFVDVMTLISTTAEYYNGYDPSFRLTAGSALPVPVPINALWLLCSLTVVLSVFGVRRLKRA